MKKNYLLTFTVLFLFIQSSFADMNTANEAMARGDHAAAAAEFKKLAEQGDKKAQANLGYMYYVGEGVPQDYTKAVQWYKKAAILGDRDSQYNLAVAYAFGEGVKQDYKEAFHWYRRAAEQNHAVAQYSLGISYAYGEGVPKNPELAAEWFKKSAEQGYERAQVLLGSLYHTGEGVEKDYMQAAIWYRKAADKGNAAAQYNLGSLYRAGNGVEQDYNQAVRWFRLSADQGYAAAQNELDSIERAVAGANRPAPTPAQEPVPEIKAEVKEETTAAVTAESTNTAKEVPAKSEVVAKSENTISTESVAAEIQEEESKQGFFSKLFGKKEPTDSTPEQSGVVYASPEEIAAAEKKNIVVPAPASAPVSSPDVELNEASTNNLDTTATAEEEPKRSFFSKLFGTQDSTNSDPVQDGVVYATPEQIKADENKTLAADPALTIADTNRPTGNSAEDIEAEAATGSTEVLSEEVRPKKGFFSKLFSDDEADGSSVETADSNTVEPEPSRVKTYAADSAPVGQQLESSSENQIVQNQTATEETATLSTQVAPAEIAVTAEAEALDEEATVTLAEPEEAAAPKKGFFAKLFGKDDAQENAQADNTSAAETGDIETTEEALVVAKLESPDSEAAISNIDVTPELENITSAAEIQPLAAHGDATAQFHLGALYYQGKTVRQDYSQAFLWYRRAAQQGNAEAQYSLGNMYLMGEGISQDDYEARQWYEKAAAQGHESAQHNLESLQRIATPEPPIEEENNLVDENDHNIVEEPEDEDSGKKRGFFSKLFGSEDKADESDFDEFDDTESISEEDSPGFDTGNSPKSIYENGLAYEFGEGVSQSYLAAFELYKKSAEQNYAPAQYKLGLAYAYGQGVEKDPEIAAEWYRKSAIQGYALAQRTLGTLYMGGGGVEQNRPLALAWYDILADNGNVMDVHRRDSLKERLTEDEIKEADKLKQALSN